MSQVRAIVDKLLTNVSSMYQPEGFVSESFLPQLQSKQSSGKLGKYGNQHLRIQNTVAGGRGAYRRVEAITRSTTTFVIDNHGLEGLVTQDDYRNVELPFRAEEDETLGLSLNLWLEKEQMLASTLTDTGVMTNNVTLSGTGQFNDYANSDPLSKFSDARKSVRNGCGLPPNAAVMDWQIANVLAYHPAILDALGFTKNRAGQLSPDELAKAMGIEKLFIAKAMYNSAKEGQTDVLSPVWGKDIVFAYVPDKAVPYQVSLGYYVVYEGKQPRQVTKFAVNNPPQSTGIVVEDSYDMLLSNVGAGYVIKSAIA
jgi:hypothetical protein